MPRDGSGASDNVVERGENLVHGAGAGDAPTSSGVDRSSKAAAPPKPEKGDSIGGMSGSGGGSFGAPRKTGSGKGRVEPTVDKIADGKS